MQYLMLVSVGPVQGFIKSARRSRDLWYGSWLLSELSKMAAATLVQHQGELIFPAPASMTDLEYGSPINVVNRIVAIFKHEPSAVGADIRANLEGLLMDEWSTARNQFPGSLVDEDTAKAQIRDLLELMWVYAPLQEDGYPAARAQAERLMASRKNTRDFRPVTWGAAAPKSSLDGMLESLVPEDAYPDRSDSRQDRDDKAQKLFTRYGAGRAERLSAVDLLKRHGNPSAAAHVPSTSDMAARPFLKRLQQEADKAAPAVDKLQQRLSELGMNQSPLSMRDGKLAVGDAQLLYEARLRTEPEEHGLKEEKVDDAVRALRGFYRSIGDALGGPIRPSPYFALLIADGDNMGRVVDSLDTPERHRAISRSLSQFASEVGQRVEKVYDGALVYSGGDDVLAFLPLHTMVDCTWALTKRFEEMLEAYRTLDANGKTISPTLSSGLVIAHHLEPLADTLALAEASERRAKEVSGKHAVSITLSKRSGADRSIAARWTSGFYERMVFYMSRLARVIPEGTPFHLLDLHRRLMPIGASGLDPEQEPMMHAEALRVLQRRRGDSGAAPIPKQEIETLHTYLKTGGSLEDLANELIVADILAEAKRLAGSDLPLLEPAT